MTTEGKDRIKKLATEIEKARGPGNDGLGFRIWGVRF